MSADAELAEDRAELVRQLERYDEFCTHYEDADGAMLSCLDEEEVGYLHAIRDAARAVVS